MITINPPETPTSLQNGPIALFSPTGYNKVMTNQSLSFKSLREKHPRFVYQGYDWKLANDELVISFDFLLEPDITFKPKINISPVTQENIDSIPKEVLDKWIFNLGMIELFSYWKVAASREILVKAGPLSRKQIDWWKDLLIRGMGEYFYTNKINFNRDDFIKISSDHTSRRPSFKFKPTREYLVPIGGGKDSALVTNLLAEKGISYDTLLSFPQSPAAMQIAGNKQIFEIKREFDPKLFELNKNGYLNGHTPFSARLAFEGSIVALLLGHKGILLANEFSANEGNVPYLGTIINHQYSKTFDFENKFRSYVADNLGSSPEYLSILRPLTELQIAALFAQNPRFHNVFRSCNRGQQEDKWCCDCPKCLFVFTILYPFLEEKELVGPIFPENLFEKESIVEVSKELMGLDSTKPFECVGTHEETQAAFYLSIKKWQKNNPGKELPIVLKEVNKKVLTNIPDLDKTAELLLCFWNKEHNLDESLEKIIKEAVEKICKGKND